MESGLFSSRLNQGTIDFELTFPHMEEGDALGSILPDRMEMNFKDGMYRTGFSAYGGVFKSSIVVDTKEQEYKQMLKVFRKKLACKFDRTDIDELMREFPPMTIVPSNKVDTIAGYPCKHAIGIFEDLNQEEIDIYYTNEIALDNPNWCSPFAEIDGVLMAYEVDMFDMRMRLRALEVQSDNFELSHFDVDEDYKVVSYRYIRTEIEKLMSSFEI